MTSMNRLSNHVTHVARQRSHHLALRFQESGVKFFRELSFIDHGEVPIKRTSKLQFLLIYDGATSLTTAYVVQNRTDSLTISHLQEYFETYQLNPKYIVADQAFMGTDLEEHYDYNRQNIVHHGLTEPKQPFACLRDRSTLCLLHCMKD